MTRIKNISFLFNNAVVLMFTFLAITDLCGSFWAQIVHPAEFAQYCENETAMGSPALFGRLRFNATPELGGNVPLAVAIFLSAPFVRKKRSIQKVTND